MFGKDLRTWRALFAILCVTVLIMPASFVYASPAASPSRENEGPDGDVVSEEEDLVFARQLKRAGDRNQVEAGVSSFSTSAADEDPPWCHVVPEEENPADDYDSILYSEIAPLLCEIQRESDRVEVEVIGQSAGGRNLFLATVSTPEANAEHCQDIRNLRTRDPAKAAEMVDNGEFDGCKVPVFFNASIHGREYTGVDAVIRLIQTLAFEDTPEVQAVLDNVIVVINVVANPDGRVAGTRQNDNGFDMNRDYITQSQPEIRAAVGVISEWSPTAMLDLHCCYDPILHGPTTPPHQPNYEWDLNLRWAFPQALSLEAEVLAQTGLPSQIPYRDWEDGWDSWAPIYTEMYSMHHGAIGYCVETPGNHQSGVDQHYATLWGLLKYVIQNKIGMFRNQIEMYRRGDLALPQQPIPDDVLAWTPYEQYNELTTIDFPAAYLIPADGAMQQSTHQAARLVDFLLYNGVEVQQAQSDFEVDGLQFDKGTYVVRLDQPKRGLANVILWDGWDVSYNPGLTLYGGISEMSNSLLWGASVYVAEEAVDLPAHKIPKAKWPQGHVDNISKTESWGYEPTSLEAIKATNDLLARGVTLYRATEPFTDPKHGDWSAGTFILPKNQAHAQTIANELKNEYMLELWGISSIPDSAVLMTQQKIAVYASEGERFVLQELGFNWEAVSTSDLNAGMISEYDVFVNTNRSWIGLNDDGRASLTAFFAAGGDYVGSSNTGVQFAIDAGLLDVVYDAASRNDSGIVNIDYDPADPVTAGMPADGRAMVSRPVWFTYVGDGIDVAATVDAGDDFFISGFWPGWDTSGAAGQPIILHAATGMSDRTLMGIAPAFRAHPEGTFGILANAIYNGLD